MHHHSTILLFYHILIFFTDFLAWISCVDFLFSLFLKSDLSAESPLLHSECQRTSQRKGGLGRDAADSLERCDSPMHSAWCSFSPSTDVLPFKTR